MTSGLALAATGFPQTRRPDPVRPESIPVPNEHIDSGEVCRLYRPVLFLAHSMQGGPLSLSRSLSLSLSPPRGMRGV